MPWVIRFAAAALAAVFVVAAVAKARDLAGTAEELAALRIRQPNLVARALIPIELAVAVALLVAPAWGAVAAFAVLAAFTAVLVGVVRSGRSASCRCFGAMSTEPISWRTVARNLVLLAVAALVAVF